jgi:hypothetical protein
MSAPASLVERVLSAVRSHPIGATLILVGIVVTSLASFTDALRKLSDFLPAARVPEINGTWQSETLKDANTKLDYVYVFEFKRHGKELIGSAQRSAARCRNSNAGVCTGFGRRVAITEGKLEADRVSFVADWGEVPGKAAWTYVHVRQRFSGTVGEQSIRFIVQDNHGEAPFEVSVSRLAR